VDASSLTSQANAYERSQRLFADGYRAVKGEDEKVIVTSPLGKQYTVDLFEDACDCPYFRNSGGELRCKHLLGWSKLLSDQGTATGNPRFPLGTVVATPGAIAALLANGLSPAELLVRHSLGDWGDLEPDDRRANDQSLLNGTRLLSSYALPDGETSLWVITEWDRSSTTILLPEEY
jgi:hypothetical protein